MSTPHPAVCSACSDDVARGGPCARCLFLAGLEDGGPCERVGGYRLIAKVGEGGMSEVYVALDADGKEKAVKRAKLELLDQPEALTAFQNEASTSDALGEGTGIVRVQLFEIDDDGRPFLVMDLFEKGTLADPSNAAHFREPKRALELVARLAETVHFAHERQVLHCDLKPSNVLLDRENRPHVADFGLACRPLRHARLRGGTPGFMAPEQASPEGSSLTTSTDVFALGAMLYHLVTGELPFGEGEEFFRRVAREAPPAPPPRRRRPELDRDFDVICAKALAKDPERRYRSAAALAEDLNAARHGLPIQGDGRGRRAWKAMRRSPWVASALFAELCIAVYLAVALLGVLSTPAATLEATIAAHNAFTAIAQAGAVMNELRADIDRVETVAREVTLRGLHERPAPFDVPPELLARAKGFDGLFLLAADGGFRARWPVVPPEHVNGRASWRDYFLGAERLGKSRETGVYVSLAYLSSVDGQYKYAYSTPLYDEARRWAGVLVAKRYTRATFGALHLDCPRGLECMTALLGPLDREGSGVAPARGVTMLAGPHVKTGKTAPIDAAFARRVCAELDCARSPDEPFGRPRGKPVWTVDFRDAVTEQRYVASVAPVGRTGFLVLVGTQHGALAELGEKLSPTLAPRFLIPGILGVLIPILLASSSGVARRRRRAGANAALGAAFALALTAVPARALAFPGVYVGKDSAERVARAAHVVVLRNQGVSVVTVMLDHEGPLTPFALILPVPADVEASRVRTLKRGIPGRLEAISAPRFHAFYEQDPCETGPVEQRWDERVRARGRGILTPSDLPPLDRHYAVSNLISAPVEPVFKNAENEFRYSALDFREPGALREWLAGRGYRIGDAALAALAPHLAGGRLLFAEVALEHVELVSGERVQLGGVRYYTRKPLSVIPATLGLAHARGVQDLFVYVLDRERRFHVVNYPNRFLPANLTVDRLGADEIASAYNALFDAAAARDREAFVTEYAWSTSGCGQPCPDAPLGLDELMSLGADVIEARPRAAEPPAEPAPEAARDRQEFESYVRALPASERARARREHERDRREIERRRALTRRHTYVLSRLHHRYDRAGLPRDVEIGPAPSAVRGGVGVPKGPGGELSRAAEPAGENELQVRFLALRRFAGKVSCAEPLRFRWGKAWASEARADRSVRLATDLASAPRDRRLLETALTSPVAELGLGKPAPAPAAAPKAVPAPVADAPRGSCAAAPRGDAPFGLAVVAAFALALARRRRLSRRPRGAGRAPRSARPARES